MGPGLGSAGRRGGPVRAGRRCCPLPAGPSPQVLAAPATTDMHFRNGAVAFAYLGTLLMLYVDEQKVTLDGPIDRWLPELPGAHSVTLKMLANQTSGYPDFETDPKWETAFNADPFHLWTYEERLRYAFERPVQFPPGTNWSYSHTNFMVLGAILARIGGKPQDVLLREKVLDPMGLRDTVQMQTSEIPEPVLHSYSSERRVALGIPARVGSRRSRPTSTPSGAHRSGRTRRRPSGTSPRPRRVWVAVPSCRSPPTSR
ncbi:serine hydrolase domain-containing protein [Pseudonocardia sp. T1-2H]|uniref:serine hydrolase domain-containing protein n=1 Tax=Pseudonocardia sp. T1-2H TaxID=3128899 RepID=UPI00310165FC